MTTTSLPHIDLKELEEWKAYNFKERLAFIDWYAEYLKTGKMVKYNPPLRSPKQTI